LSDDRANIISLREEYLEGFHARFNYFRNRLRCQLRIAVSDDFAGGSVNKIVNSERAGEFAHSHLDLFDFGLDDRIVCAVTDLLARLDDHFALAVEDLSGRLRTDDIRADLVVEQSLVQVNSVDGVEGPKNLLVALQTECPQKDRGQEFALAIDPN